MDFFSGLPIIGLLIFFIIIKGFFIVKQQTIAIVERLGKFQGACNPGFHIRIPFLDRIAGRMSIRVQQLDVNVETKTKDDVFVKIRVSVQYQVIKDKVYEAFYKLQSSEAQITSYIFDTVRAEVPKLKLDDVFEKKDEIAIAIKRELTEAMNDYGYGIIKALVTDIDPDEEVKIAMNKINAAERTKLAAEYEAEADRIKIVVKAQAEAESKKLQGKGIADQRREIAQGLEDSVDILSKVGINSTEASALIVVTQHYDTLQSMGTNANSNLILLPTNPSSGSDMIANMVTSFVASKKLGDEPSPGPTKSK